MRVIYLRVLNGDRRNILRADTVNSLLSLLGSSNYVEDPEGTREFFGRTIRLTTVNATSWQPTHVVIYSPVLGSGGVIHKNSPSIYHVTRADLLADGHYRLTADLCGTWTALLRASGVNNLQVELDRYSADDGSVWSTDEPIDTSLETVETQKKTFDPLLDDLRVVITTYRLPSTSQGTDWPVDSSITMTTKGQITSTPPYSFVVTSNTATEWAANEALDRLVHELWHDSANAAKYVYRIQLVPRQWIETETTAYQYHYYAGDLGVYLKQLKPYSAPTTIGALSITRANLLSAGDNVKADYHGRIRIRHRRDLIYDGPLDNVALSGLQVKAHTSVSAGVNLYADLEIAGSQPDRLPISAYEITSLASGLTIWWESAKSQIIAQGATSIISLGIGIAATVAGSGAGIPALAMSVASIGSQAAGIYQQATNANRQVVKMGIGASMLALNDGSVPYLEVDLVQYKSAAAAVYFFRQHGYAGYWRMSGLTPARQNYNAYQGSAVLYESRNVDSGLTGVSTQEINEAMAEEMSAGVVVYDNLSSVGKILTVANPDVP